MTRHAGSMRLCLFFRERLGRSLRETYIRIDGSFEREKAGGEGRGRIDWRFPGY